MSTSSTKNDVDQTEQQMNTYHDEEGVQEQQDKRGAYSLAQGRSDRGRFANGDTLFYPQELFTPSQPHGVHFYINARSNSAAAISQGQAEEATTKFF